MAAPADNDDPPITEVVAENEEAELQVDEELQPYRMMSCFDLLKAQIVPEFMEPEMRGTLFVEGTKNSFVEQGSGMLRMGLPCNGVGPLHLAVFVGCD